MTSRLLTQPSSTALTMANYPSMRSLRQALRPLALFLLVLFAADAEAQQRATVRSDTFLRAQATATARTIVNVAAGAEVTVVRAEGAWRFVRTAAGAEGYIHESFLNIQGGTAAPAPPATPPATPAPPTPPRQTPPPSRPAPQGNQPARPAQPARPPAAPRPANALVPYGTVDFGIFMPSAKDSFKAVFGKSNMTPIGVGGGIFRGPLFVEGAFRFASVTGERVLEFEGEVIPLGVKDTLSIKPFTVTAGWRSQTGTIRPYVGGGFGIYMVKETSDFALPEEDVDEKFNGFHVLGGVRYPVTPMIQIGGEAEFSSVKNSLGTGLSGDLGEDNLGGFSIRVRVSIGSFGATSRTTPARPAPAPPRPPARRP